MKMYQEYILQKESCMSKFNLFFNHYRRTGPVSLSSN